MPSLKVGREIMSELIKEARKTGVTVKDLAEQILAEGLDIELEEEEETIEVEEEEEKESD